MSSLNELTPYNFLLMTLQQMAKVFSFPLTRTDQGETNHKVAAELVRHFHPQATSRRSKCPFFNVQSQSESDKSQTKTEVGLPLQNMPGPKGLPIIGTLLDLLMSGSAPKIHQYCDRRHKEYGPIYREVVGSVEAVFIADSALIRRVFASEGKFPQHLVPEPWILYNEMNNNKRGLFFMDGPLWRERRRSLNKVFLRRTAVAEHIDDFAEVTSDLVERWNTMRCPQTGVLADLEKELYNWSIECLGSFIFGRRMGCVNTGSEPAPVDDEIHTFVQCVQQIFTESAKMTTIPPRLARALRLPVWRRFNKAVTNALTIARTLVETKVREIVSKAESGEPVEGMLAQLLLDDHIDEEEIVRIVTDLFLAAADTTSHSTQWALYLLARNPRCQERLRQEMDEMLPRGEHVTLEKLGRLPYARAVVKESLRLYPVAPFLTRILTNDLNLGGYHVPKGKLVLMSMFTTGRDPESFDAPNEFRPERWMSTEGPSAPSHACLPFGSGSRSCIGRRIAEAQMYLLFAQVVQDFILEPANENEIEITLRMVTTPSEPIRLRLVDRQ